ncbi:MAG: flotillin-like FloA family protein, partial [Clostridia bacterium]|nr:flotillin-like FloA family protein [Clostridia bacterium]
MQDITMIMAVLVAVVLIIVVYFFARFFPIGLWISALASGVKIKISILIGMRFRRIAPGDIVKPLIKATKAGLDININEMEAHLLAGGRLNMVIDALIAAQAANIDLSFESCRAIDLA